VTILIVIPLKNGIQYFKNKKMIMINNPENFSLNRKEEIEKEIDRLKSIIEKGAEILKKFDSMDAEYKSVNTIIIGLSKKLEILTQEDKDKSTKIPETDEEWDSCIARTERIQRIRVMIDNLYIDLDDIGDKIYAIEKESELI
jgi:hypothetical protein